jgi:hypothetical protein
MHLRAQSMEAAFRETPLPHASGNGVFSSQDEFRYIDFVSQDQWNATQLLKN